MPNSDSRITALQENVRRLKGERDAALERASTLDDLTDDLRRSEERYRSLFARMTEGFALGEPILDQEGKPRDIRFLEINNAFERQTGLSPQIVGKPLGEVLPRLEKTWVDIYGGVALGGDPVRFEQFNRDTGRYYDVFCYRPVRGRFAILFRDVTGEKTSEAALRESEERFRSTFEQAAVGMAHIGLDGRFLRFNQRLCDIVGYSREELQKKTFMEITFPEDLDADLAQANRLRRGEIDHYQMEKRYLHQEGRIVWINLTGALQRGAGGDPQFYIAVIEDISDRKAMEEEIVLAKTAAEEASRAKSQFVANMSHEIRTPMTAFMAALEHLQSIDQDPERRRILNIADQSARRLRSLIDDILDFSRIEARRVELKEEPFELVSWLRGIQEMFSLPAREKSLDLVVDLAPDLPPIVVGDPDRVGQVLVNLVGNAVKFTPEGEIRVLVRRRGHLLEFSVADTGVGIPEEKCDLLFESFSQLDGSYHRRHEGTGLGLAISKGLVALMEGEISVRSREGEGSEFTFTIPLKTVDRPDPAPAKDRAEETAGPGANLRILLAEDEPLIQEVIVLMLKKRGCRAEAVGTGRDALARWEQGAFDLILMDLQMPEMNGIEATRAIRGREEAAGGRKTFIVGLTAHARPEIKEECLASGMDDLLLKPVQMQELFAMIDRFLDRKPLDHRSVSASRP